MNKKIILWTNGTENLFPEEGENNSVGGIQVQMYMWATILVQNDWEVYTFTPNNKKRNKSIKNINFLYFPTFKFINPISSLLYSYYYIARYRPRIILINGATRDLLLLNLIARIYKSKTIQMFASDSDLEPGKELIARKFDRLLFRIGLQITDSCIVQNKRQTDLLLTNYNKLNPLEIPLIWLGENEIEQETKEKEHILWVSNFKQLKRPEWFLRLAKDNPNFKFVMVGNSTDVGLFEKCKQIAADIPNLDFLGGLSFNKTNELFKSAHLFVCTSEIEGFPNTFVQAWMNVCPILTSFDPNDLIKNLNLGVYCKNYEEFNNALYRLSDNEFTETVKSNIKTYYKNTFSAQMHYERLIERFDLL